MNRNLSFFTTGYNYLIQLIPALIVAPLFIRGQAEFGVISQSSMAFAHVLGAFSLIVNQFPMLSSYAAIVARLNALADAAEAAAARASAGIVVVEDESRLAFERLTLLTPRDGRALVRELSVELRAGSRLLVRGPRDATDALQRAVAGVSQAGHGRVLRPAGDGVLVVTDQPYLTGGTLRELLGNGAGGPAVADDRIRAAMHQVGLDGVVQRAGSLDVDLDRDFLSPEEQRLVEVARLLLAAPRFALLARLEAGIGAARAAEVLAALTTRGIGYVVLGDDALASEHFDAVVDIAPDGTWRRTVRREHQPGGLPEPHTSG